MGGVFIPHAWWPHANRPEVARDVVVTLSRPDPGMSPGLIEGID